MVCNLDVGISHAVQLAGDRVVFLVFGVGEAAHKATTLANPCRVQRDLLAEYFRGQHELAQGSRLV